MAGKFEVYEDSSGKFRFRLKASNGEVVASSPAVDEVHGAGYFPSKAAAKLGCESVLEAADGAPIVEVEK